MTLTPESNVTAPSEWCPHTERWSSVGDEPCEVEVSELMAAFVRAVHPDFVLETGTAFAQTTTTLTEAIERNGHGHLYSIDYTPERVMVAQEALAGRPVTVVQASSFDWVPPEGVAFQLAFLDCDFHHRHTVFHHFRPWLSAGAIVAFHDISPGFTDGPYGYGAGMPLLDPLVEEGLLRLITLHTPRGLAIAEVL